MEKGDSLSKIGRKEERGKEEREGGQKEDIKEAELTRRKGEEEKGKVRWRVGEKDGGGKRSRREKETE